MPTRRHQMPDLFDEHLPDPVEAATGRRQPSDAFRPGGRKASGAAPAAKRKAGFYLSDDLLERFNTRFYELKLAGAAVGNKSALLEAALGYALDDLDRGVDSRILKRIGPMGRRR
ncbi:MAG: hypothetical protein HY895_00495 [Deltaproteobacteria bacterium]|nr:hypothetical protein [Deltaproteobacteria bacterium]